MQLALLHERLGDAQRLLAVVADQAQGSEVGLAQDLAAARRLPGSPSTAAIGSPDSRMPAARFMICEPICSKRFM